MARQNINEIKGISTGLSSYIRSMLSLMDNNRAEKDQRIEQDFNNEVASGNLDLEGQLSFRQNQLDNLNSGDKSEINRIKTEISNLKVRIKQKAYTDAYQQKLADYNSGIGNSQDVLNWLNTRLVNTTDPAIQSSIRQSISSISATVFQQRQSLLTEATNYALKDNTLPILSKQINAISAAKLKAQQDGNDNFATTLGIQLDNLNSAYATAQVNKSMMDFTVGTMTGNSALQNLNQFDKEINNSSATTPVTINGKNYDSAQQFWQIQRSNYLNDQSSTGFFSQYKKEINNNINTDASKGYLTNDSLGKISQAFDSLSSRADMAGYKDQIAQNKQDSLDSAAKIRSTSIINSFLTNEDANKALQGLADLQTRFGVDQTTNYQTIVAKAAQTKQAQVGNILSVMNTLMGKNPGMTPSQAMQKAISSGAAASPSPEKMATTSATDIIKGFSDKSGQGTFNNPEAGTIKPEAAAPFNQPKGLQEGQFYKQPDSSTVYQYKGGQLNPLSGNWSEDQFKQFSGKSFADVKPISDVSSIPQGTAIKPSTAPVNQESLSPSGAIAEPAAPVKPNPEPATPIMPAGASKLLTPKEFSDMQKTMAPADVENKVIRSGNDIYLKQ